MNSRNQSLDVLRGIAVLLVICNHYRYLSFMRSGWIGVDLFFVLSGFLISGLLFSEIIQRNTISVGRFLLRRGLKIYPAFYVFIGITALMNSSLRHDHRMFSELFFLQSYLPRIWGHTWSLAVEEHFYLLLPLLILALHRSKKLYWIPGISIALGVICLILRVLTALRHPGQIESVMMPSHLRFDSLFAGVALGYIYHFQPQLFRRASRIWLLPVGLLCLVPSFADPDPTASMASGLLFFNAIGFLLITLWATPRDLRAAPIAEIGRYSYSIYLWHMIVTGFWRSFPITAATFLGDLSTCLAIGVSMGVIVEFPILHLRDKFIPSALRRRASSILVAAAHKGVASFEPESLSMS
jgi:peptidoglycan/LPS O-acetylase OafA/YrhL